MTETKGYEQTIIGVIWSGHVANMVEDMYGCDAVTIYSHRDLDDYMDHIDGLILTGGGDVNPFRYSNKKIKGVYGIDDRRDRLEMRAIKMARKRRIPIFGICRGQQIINVTLGGTLYQDIESRKQTHVVHGVGQMHNITIHKDTELFKWLGARQIVGTAIHHQAIRKLATNLRAAGVSDDGYIESIESKNPEKWFVLGTQFHPEMDMADDQEKCRSFRLVEMFINEAARYSNARDESYDTRIGEVWSTVTVTTGDGTPTNPFALAAQAMIASVDSGKMMNGNTSIPDWDGTPAHSKILPARIATQLDEDWEWLD